ncbi:hypothetical protein HYV22_02940 [Candidatus Gottesmanbacteria bacterium]|nr:hypothetical protein [Candidatus Gottesmanbacteria bacterium]
MNRTFENIPMDDHIFLNPGHTSNVYNVGLIRPEDVYECITPHKTKQRMATIEISGLVERLLANPSAQTVFFDNLRQQLSQATVSSKKQLIEQFKTYDDADPVRQKKVADLIEQSQREIGNIAKQIHAVQKFLDEAREKNITWDKGSAPHEQAIQKILADNLRALKEK